MDNAIKRKSGLSRGRSLVPSDPESNREHDKRVAQAQRDAGRGIATNAVPISEEAPEQQRRTCPYCGLAAVAFPTLNSFRVHRDLCRDDGGSGAEGFGTLRSE